MVLKKVFTDVGTREVSAGCPYFSGVVGKTPLTKVFSRFPLSEVIRNEERCSVSFRINSV